MSESNRSGDTAGHPGQLDLFSGSRNDALPVASTSAPPARCVRSPTLRESSTPRDGGSLLDRLTARLSTPVRSLTLTRNRTRIVSARPASGGGLDIRIHRCFEQADDVVVQGVVDFLENRSESSRKRGLRQIREHFRAHGQEDNDRLPILRPRGAWFDLVALRDRVNRDYFAGRLNVEITWSQGSNGRRRRSKAGRRRNGSFSIRLGSYDERLRLVRIHPVLDREEVPEYVVESIVYHEMLHAVVPPRPGAQRRNVHPPEFRRLEKLYARFEEAEAWLEANVERLARMR